MNIGTQATARERTRQSAKTTLALKPNATRVSADTRHNMIAEAAYFLAQRRGFADGHAMEDWLQAEIQIDAMLTTISARR